MGYMFEREPVLPYDMAYIREWCDSRGIDDGEFGHLAYSDFSVAVLRRQELSLAAKYRQEIEDSLPLAGCTLVDDPRVRPDEAHRPKLCQAPEGMAFELTETRYYRDIDEWGEKVTNGPLHSTTLTFTGEFLDIETYVNRGKPRGVICVRERPNFFAAPIVNYGCNLVGLVETDMIRLPSKNDPTKDGAYVAFPRVEGWDIVRSGNKLEADYPGCTVRIVPYEKPTKKELYVADFGKAANFALDEFRYFEEPPQLPDGYFYLPRAGEKPTLHVNKVHALILPPIESRDWDDLWYHHGIMLKLNPTVQEGRYRYVDVNNPHDIDKTNELAAQDKLFRRLLVVQHLTNTSLRQVVSRLAR